MGGRFCYSALDLLGRKYKIRVIHPDRPGVGGSDAVAIEDRISTYVDMIPKLMNYLEIEHVSLAAHSFGTIYLINILLTCPYLLHPERPCVAFFTPWVHPEHTGVKHLQAVEMLPASMIGKFSSLARFVNEKLVPLVGMSTGLSSTVANSVKTSLPHTIPPGVPVSLEPHTGGRREQRDIEGEQSLDLNDSNVVKELGNLVPTFLFAEENAGVGQDTQLCLRKPRSIPWSTLAVPWKDFDDAVRAFERLRGATGQDNRMSEATKTLRVDVFHAETDSLVGHKGQEWFDSCWKRDEDAASGSLSPFEYYSQTVKGSDHDSILDLGLGASETWLKGVGDANRGVGLRE